MVDGGSGGVDHASGNYVSGPHTRWPAQNPTLLPSWPVTETVYVAAEWLEAVRVSGKLAMGRMLCVPVYRLYVVRCRLIGVVKRRERNLHFSPFLTRTQCSGRVETIMAGDWDAYIFRFFFLVAARQTDTRR